MESMHEDVKAIERGGIGGASLETIGGGAAVVLSVIGLANIWPAYMASIASIVLGGALLLEGGFIAAEFSRILRASGSSGFAATELGGGLSTQTLTGGAAIVLGILALVQIAPGVLLSISAIVLGAGILIGSGINSRLNAIKIERMEQEESSRKVARAALSSATGAQVLVGMSAVALGVIALVGVATGTLILVAFLAIGASILLSGAAIAGRMASLFRA